MATQADIQLHYDSEQSHRVAERTIWLKPHRFGDGKRMILSDFAHFVLNRPNPRITAAFQNAFNLD